MGKIKVLFLCTSNSSRSQMAEAFLRKYGGDRFDAYSAGLEPKGIDPNTERVMEEVGVSLDGQHSKHVQEYMGKIHFSYLITVCHEAEKNCPTVFPGVGQRLHWSFEDPSIFMGSEAERLAKFRQVRDQIEQQVKSWIAGKQTK
jgi:arsenate reductase (thioredoxin)